MGTLVKLSVTKAVAWVVAGVILFFNANSSGYLRVSRFSLVGTFLCLGARMCETFLRTMSNVEKTESDAARAMSCSFSPIVPRRCLFRRQQSPVVVAGPEEAKQLKNPCSPRLPWLKSAREVYLDKCAHCHGDTGKGDGRGRPAGTIPSRRISRTRSV